MSHDRLIRKSEALKLTGISATTLWRLEKSGQFPARVQVGPNTVAYRLSEVETWMDSRPTSTIPSKNPQAA